MAASLVLVSERTDDLEIARHLSKTLKMPLHQVNEPIKIYNYLTMNPMSIVLWDASREKQFNDIKQAIGASAPPNKVFALTKKPMSDCSQLYRNGMFNHHIRRRTDALSLKMISQCAGATFQPFPFGLDRFIIEPIESQKIEITASEQKEPALEVVDKFLRKRGLKGRLATTIVESLDELIMNATFDAPVDENGNRYRMPLERATKLTMTGKEKVSVQIMLSKEFGGTCVADQFGSLGREVVRHTVQRSYKKNSYEPPQEASAGLGLLGIVQKGLSLVMISKRKWKTEAMLFWPNVEDYRGFRNHTQIFSVHAE